MDNGGGQKSRTEMTVAWITVEMREREGVDLGYILGFRLCAIPGDVTTEQGESRLAAMFLVGVSG